MREVVMEQEAAFYFALFQVIHEPLVFLGSQRGCYQRLGLTASEQSRTMNARQPPNFAADRTNFREAAAIRTAALVENIVAENGFLQVIENLLGHLSSLGLVFGIAFDH